MALAYLLSPTFEIVNTAGKPATGGYIEVYVSGTRDKYFCASDWNGTLHPFKIPLDSLGSNIVLAADGGAYDVFIYNRYGGLIMSRTNVKPGAGGGMGGGVITSSDGSITVTPTAEGVDLKVNGMEPSVLRAGAGSLTADGQYTFYELVRDGEEITVDSNGKIRLEDGWYHFDATVRVAWEGASLVNSTTPVQLYTTLSSDVLEFDLSYEHSETVQLGGEVKIATGGTQFILGITGLEQGMVAELVDFGIHTITGHGDAAGYEAGDGIVIEDHEISIDPNYVQETLSAGTGIVLEDNEISVDTDVIQEKLTAGSNIVIEGTTISATAEPQLQASWTEDDSQSVQYIQNKPTIKPVVAGSNITITEGANNVTISSQSDPQVQADYAQSNSSAVDYIKNKPTIKPVVAGSNITITEDSSNVTIASTDTTYTAGNGLDLTGTEFSVDTTEIQEKLTAGSNIQISNGVISATDTTYTAGDGLSLNGTEFTVNVGPNLYIDPNTHKLGAVDTLPMAGYGLYNSSYYMLDVDTSVIQQKLTAGSNIVIEGTTISATAEPQLQASWTEDDSQSVQYIQNKPVEKSLVAGNNITITTSGNNVTVAATDTTYTAGTNVQINGTTISATDTTYSAGNGITLSGTEFAIDTTVVATKSDLPEDEIFYVDVANPDYDTALAAYNAGKTLVLKGDYYTGYLCRYTPMDGLVFAYNLPWTVAGVATATQVGYMAMRKVTATGETYWYGFSSCAIPNATQEDSGKVLTVSGSNVATWTSLPDYVTDVEVDGTSVVNAQGIAEITMPTIPVTDVEVDGVSVVSNGVASITTPAESTVVAGSNITITESNSTITIAASVPVIGTITI